MAGLDDDWVYSARDDHRDRLIVAYGRLAAAAEQAGDLAAAVRWTRRLVSHDPLSEEAHRELIRRLAEAGDRPSALAAFAQLRTRLADELHMTPSATTRELVEEVRREARAAGRPRGAARLPPALGMRRGPPFVGRGKHLERLRGPGRASVRARLSSGLSRARPVSARPASRPSSPPPSTTTAPPFSTAAPIPSRSRPTSHSSRRSAGRGSRTWSRPPTTTATCCSTRSPRSSHRRPARCSSSTICTGPTGRRCCCSSTCSGPRSPVRCSSSGPSGIPRSIRGIRSRRRSPRCAASTRSSESCSTASVPTSSAT